MAREYWILIDRCGECREPIPIDLVQVLGNNEVGVDGHLFHSKVQAEQALADARILIKKSGVYCTVVGSDDIVRYDLPQRKRYDLTDLDNAEAVQVIFPGLE